MANPRTARGATAAAAPPAPTSTPGPDPVASPRPDRDPERPVYVISVAASIVSAHPRTLRIYEDEGLLCPARTPTNIRLYSENDIRRILWIRHLTRERGVNLAGIRILFELEERLGARILEALYAEGTGDAVGHAADRTGRSAIDRRPTVDRPTVQTHVSEAPPRRHRHRTSGEATDGQATVQPGRGHAAERDRDGTPRPAPRRTPGDGHLPGDDRPAPGGPREERQRAQRRGRRGRTHRARHPAPGRAGGHRRSLRALRRRHAGQDRPGRPAPGRHRPGHRPGPVAPAPARLQPDRTVPARVHRGAARRDARRPRGPGAHAHGPGPDRAVRRQRRAGAAGGGRRRAQHHRARPAGRHGRLQPGHDHRAAPGAARDDRRRRAPQARLQLPRPPGRDPRAEGAHPVRGQVRDGQDPARVHPARAAQGDPARAGRGRPAAGRDQRAAREGRSGRHARRDQGPGDQGDRPDEPDPVGLARGRRHPDVRGLADRPAVERRRPTTSSTSRKPRASSTRTTTASRRSRSASSSTSRCARWRTRSAARSSPSSDPPGVGKTSASARASPGRWAASSCG